MNHNQIKSFLEIANEKSFTKAAKKLYLTQPAISRYISSFEKELGLSLFDRTNKQVTLTEAGELYYDLFRRFEVEFENIDKKTSKLNCKRHGQVRMGYLVGWSVSDFLPSILKSFSKKNPDISVSVECLEMDELIQALVTNKLDVVLALDDCLNGIRDINRQKITEIDVLILYSIFHQLAEKDSLTPYDFKDEVFYVVDGVGVNAREREIRNYCKGYNFVPHLKQVQSMESILASVENGLGVTFLDIWGRNIHSSSFKHILLDSKHEISMAWNKMNKSETVQLLVNEVLVHFENKKIK